MNLMKIFLPSLEQTLKIGNFIGQLIELPSFICLIGDLGTGKTSFTKGLAQGLGIKDNITSPTFTLINEFSTGAKNLFHFDLYRLENPEEIFLWDLDEYLKKQNSLVVIEWADRLKDLNNYAHLDIYFEYSEVNNGRNIILNSSITKYLSLLKEVQKFVSTWA